MNKHSLCLLLLTLAFLACNSQTPHKSGKEATLALPGFEQSKGRETVLPAELDEISGIVRDPGRNEYLAIEDENGTLYVLNAGFGIRARYDFGPAGDYEDLALAGNEVYVLRSDGALLGMSYNGKGIGAATEYANQHKKTEFEALAADPAQNRLLLVTKTARKDKEARATHMYAFDLATHQFKPEPVAALDWNAIGAKAGTELKSFNPSAAAIHPQTGELYVLSSMQKMLVVFDRDFRPLQAIVLNKKIFRQPEGLSFDGFNLIITNEAAGKQPTLLYFPYSRK